MEAGVPARAETLLGLRVFERVASTPRHAGLADSVALGDEVMNIVSKT
jgi:hypothetical protein